MNTKLLSKLGEDDYIVAHVPALKSCWSPGKTRGEALENIQEAIDLYLGVKESDEYQLLQAGWRQHIVSTRLDQSQKIFGLQ